MNIIFPSYLYYKYQAPNAEQLTNSLSKYTEKHIDNSKFVWGKQCSVERIPLKWEDYSSLLEPSINIFASDIGLNFNYKMHDPWLNFYNRGQHQEIHDHHESGDFSCVFFINSGENFSDFYFRDRNSTELSYKFRELVKQTDTYALNDIKAGDIVFFPSHMLHGASPHNSDTIRKTFAANFDINT